MRLAALGLLVVLSAVPVSGQDGRTFVERLPLDAPQSTVGAFVAAFEARDYFSAYYMLSAEARGDYLNHYYLLDLRAYFDLPADGFIDGSLFSAETEGVPKAMLDEIVHDPALTFDNLTFHATANGQMPFSLDGAVMGAVTTDGADRARVEVALTGPPDTVEFSLVRVFAENWRVDRISWSGSDPDTRPWGLPEAKSKDNR